LTDLIGFLLIIPVTRKFFISIISSKFKNRKINNNNNNIIEGSVDETQQKHNDKNS